MSCRSLEEIKAAVRDTHDIEQSMSALSALDESISICRDLAKNALDAFLESPGDGYLIAERLFRFGSFIGDFAWEGFCSTPDDQNGKRTLLIVLLYSVRHPRSDELFLDQLSREAPSQYLSLLVERIREDSLPRALPILLERAKEIFASGGLGRSFESNSNKDALAAILSKLEQHTVSFHEDFNDMSESGDYPAEIERILRTKRPRSDRQLPL